MSFGINALTNYISGNDQAEKHEEIERGVKTLSCDGESTTADVEQKYDLVRFTVSDIHGIGKCRIVPGKHFAHLSKDGVQIFCGSIAFGPRSNFVPHDEVLAYNMGNAVLRPQLDTLVPLPWAASGEFRIGEVLCESFWGPEYDKKVIKKMSQVNDKAQDNNQTDKNALIAQSEKSFSSKEDSTIDDGTLTPQAACPRYVARRLLERLEKEFGFILYSSFEAEFICYKQGTLEPVFPDNDVLTTHNTSEFESYLGHLYKGLSGAGVEIEALQTEFESGQFELAMRPSIGIRSADGMFRVKQGVKEISRQRAMDATFMTKPDHTMKMSGTGLHFNHSLLDKSSNKNVMYDEKTEDNLSDVMRWWLAGLMKHSRALTALCCPTYNCYRRLHVVPAPGKVNWGHDDRNATFRVKAVRGPPACCYLESRLPSGASNSYVVLAATLAAGMSGLKQRLTLPPENNGTEEDLPRSLEEALEVLEKDEVMVEALGEGFVKWFVRVKREVEIAKLKENRIDLERNMYMKLL